MAQAVILEFEGVGPDEYNAVNGRLGIDPASGEGEWPDGLLFHTGASKTDGFVVFELWDSRHAQERFMNERLGQALQEGGITSPPSRVEWLDVAAYHALGD